MFKWAKSGAKHKIKKKNLCLNERKAEQKDKIKIKTTCLNERKAEQRDKKDK